MAWCSDGVALGAVMWGGVSTTGRRRAEQFGTLVVDAEARTPQLPAHDDGDGMLSKMRRDHRVTRPVPGCASGGWISFRGRSTCRRPSLWSCPAGCCLSTWRPREISLRRRLGAAQYLTTPKFGRAR